MAEDQGPLTLEELIEICERLQAHRPVKAFVCTPETFREIKRIAYRESRVRPHEPIVWGIPVRVEDEPDPQPGEVELRLA